MSLEPPAKRLDEAPDTVEMPSPTAWPIVLAFGITLVFAGMVTTASVSILGAILALCGYTGWFRDVLPHEKHGVRAGVGGAAACLHQPSPGRPGKLDARTICTGHGFPLRLYPISAGVKGGLAGSVAMAVLAMAYGIVAQHSIWYPINLLAAGFFPARRPRRSNRRLSTGLL